MDISNPTSHLSFLLRNIQILVRVRWELKREPEFTWKRKTQCVKNTRISFQLNLRPPKFRDEISKSRGYCNICRKTGSKTRSVL